MGPEDRLIALCDQQTKRVTGIDFIQIVDPHVQTLLRMFFVIDPDTLINPLAAALPSSFPPEKIEIRSTTGGDPPLVVPATSATWRRFTTPAGDRTVLEIQVAEPGGFSPYRLTIHDEPLNRVDRFFNGVVFSFKQGCPSVFDCRQSRDCPPDQPVDWPVDYLARDFESLRNALLDFAAQRYPLWRERVPADGAAMIMELAAAVGDEFAYIQDRIARESTLPALAERRSLWWHTQLVDYTIDEGASATAWLDIQIIPGQQGAVPAGRRVWATPEREPPIPFELGHGLADQRAGTTFWLSDAWNSMPVYVPDGSQPCLFAGATQLFLVGQFPQAAQLPQPMPDPTRFWIGRPMLIRTDPADPAEPSRRFLVHITEVENTTDPLLLVGGNPLAITRIAWQSDEALPFDLCLPDAGVHGNLVLSTVGETFTEFFAIASNSNAPAALRDQVAIAVERQGPLNATTRTRPPIFLYSLARTERRGLGRLDGIPEVELQEVVSNGAQLGPRVPPRFWQWNPTPIDALAEDLAYTLDFGTWRKVITFDRPAGRLEHLDRASGAGATIRFGDGDFGVIPSDGTLFQVRYRTDVGTHGNLAADSVTVLQNLDPASSWPTLLGVASSVTNPFAITDGRDPQDMDRVKQLAPEAYQANPRRAVRDEDYRAIAEEESWVQRAGATRRWTGSWLTEFVTADPEGTTLLSADHRAQLEQEMDCVRQAGRPAVVRDPVYRPIDLRIRICVDPDAYEGQVLERVTEALAGPRRPGKPVPFFDPDNFTFGQPLYRAALEAAIQAVPGVLAVEHIRTRVRGLFDWRPFAGFVFRPGDDRILRLDNDPSRPEAGSLIVTTRELQ
jgi:hypothetical protein